MEHKTQPLATSKVFFLRMTKALCSALMIISMVWLIGTIGYHELGGFEWIDALYNAAMILSGMGPVGNLTNDAAKLFASVYAISSGVIFIGLIGLVLAPVFHRLMHRLHLQEK